MDLKNTIGTVIVAALGKKFGAKFGSKFGLTPQQITTIAAVGIPILLKFLSSRKGKEVIKGKLRK